MTGHQQQPFKGIVLKLVQVFLVVLMLTIIKWIDGLPVTELMFFRSFFAFLPLLIFVVIRGNLKSAIHTRRPLGHFLRTLLSLATTGLTFVAVRALPLPEAVTLQYTQPMFVVALSAVLLREPVRAFRWAGVAVGFCGALIITYPKLTLLTEGGADVSQAELVGTVAALAAAAAYALNVLTIGQLVKTESSITISLWLGIYCSVLLLLTAPFGWVMPTLEQFALLVLVGLVGGALLIALSESLRAAPASTTAPFEYASLLYSSVLGYAVFGDVIGANTLVGGVLLICAGIAILSRERHLKRNLTANSVNTPPEA
ncbi:DMT family transporter [Roseovarius sp. PS-C2]|uniref:DMT family transporter n=1 Tax=Roseovarius sp. PS-C2 TaxID=2820814 RepID=UPI001C0D7112|nr:DMT family transporter [Roseovarius sp. PS-C2]MBU3259874.1 DMT family transporter [Roseovarius sp. PS-C2]